MFQLMIVDDEPDHVDSLADNIPWSDHDIHHVFKAYSGDSAIEIIRTHSVDIIISDIRMPEMSGLELIEKIHAVSPKTRCIILTGYSDFSYAQQAIRNKTDDYLLKPIRYDHLVASVQKVMDSIKRQWEEASSYQRAIYTLQEHIPVLKEKLLLELIKGKRYSRETLQAKLKLYDIPYQIDDLFCFMLIRMEDSFTPYDINGLSLLEYGICNIAKETFENHFDIWHTKDEFDYLAFLVRFNNGDRSKYPLLEEKAVQLQNNVHTFLHCDISILLSPSGTFPEEVRTHYQTAISGMMKHIGSENGLFTAMTETSGPYPVQYMKSLYDPPTLHHLLESGGWDSAEEKIERICGELNSAYESTELILEAFFVISSAFSYILHKNNRKFSDLLDEDYMRTISKLPAMSIQKLQDWSLYVLHELIEVLNAEKNDHRAAVINKVKEFIGQNMMKDLSLQMLANHVYLHPVYLSKIFKLETGEKLVLYISRVKMGHAAHLLKTTDSKIFEICDELGYYNRSYFIQQFKKHYGLTPQEYRKN
ncbi:response regulator [Paenibacillus solisilvae]|uniref:Response regulator n=1 Tax=Paenibacillus solisilvae TaxID=2486751 RepID=A0ABW0VT61_9BACL